LRRLAPHARPTLRAACAALAWVALLAAPAAHGEQEVDLYNREGVAIAFIDASDLTIYMWNGEPAAYLLRGSDGVFNAYGYNGLHLGWYSAGVLYANDGSAVCAMAERLSYTYAKVPRNRRQLVRERAKPETAPPRPPLDNTFSVTPCEVVLDQGSER
jgi:hypothetical protein